MRHAAETEAAGAITVDGVRAGQEPCVFRFAHQSRAGVKSDF